MVIQEKLNKYLKLPQICQNESRVLLNILFPDKSLQVTNNKLSQMQIPSARDYVNNLTVIVIITLDNKGSYKLTLR